MFVTVSEISIFRIELNLIQKLNIDRFLFKMQSTYDGCKITTVNLYNNVLLTKTE